jgi:sugar O-acyltransferase (sialic acid O-acetyltransferase NeuD family)
LNIGKKNYYKYKKMKKVLIGNGGHAREVMAQMGIKLLRFVDDQYVDEDTLPLSQFDPTKHVAMVAIANSKDRYDMVQKLPKETQFFTFIHPTALIMGDVEIGEGSFIGAYSILTTNIKIGKHAILNRGNQIGHDCRIGNYFSAMPGSIVSGNVTIYDLVYMGTNSSIREKLSIHSLSTIGMNSAVIKSIEDSGTYAGCPVKILKK